MKGEDGLSGGKKRMKLRERRFCKIEMSKLSAEVIEKKSKR